MSFKYLDLKRLRGGKMQLGLMELAKAEFKAEVLCYWLTTVLEQYKRSGVSAEYSVDTQRFLLEHERDANSKLGKLSAAGKLLVEAVTHACGMPAAPGFDETLMIIDRSYAHAVAVSAIPIPSHKIQFTTRKHRDTRFTRLMTLKGDIVGALGFEAAALAVAALVRAVERDLNVKITVLNYDESFGVNSRYTRLAPVFVNPLDWKVNRYLVDHLCREVDLDHLRKSVGIIKVIHDHFEPLQTPETVYPRNLQIPGNVGRL